MRVVNRFIYAIVLALGLYTVFNVTHTRTLISELQIIGQQELDDNNFQAFVTTRFSYDTPITTTSFEFDDMAFDIYAYEVANVDNETFEVYEGIQFIINQTSGDALPLPMQVMINEDTEMIYEIIQVVGLPIYTLYPGAEEPYFTVASFEESTFNNLTFIKEDSIRYSLNVDVSVLADNIKTCLESHTETFNEVPENDFCGVSVGEVIRINTTPNILIFSSIYIVLAGVVTWFFFFKPNTRKGKQKATTMLKESINEKR